MYGPRDNEERHPPRPAGRTAHSRGSGAPRDASQVLGRDRAATGTAAIRPAAFTLTRFRQLGEIGLDDLLTWVQDGWSWIVAAVIICVTASLLYVNIATPRFTVFTDILIDPAALNVVSNDVFTTNPQRDAQLLDVESKLRVLTSRNVLMRVIDTLKLTSDPEFTKPDVLTSFRQIFADGSSAQADRLGVIRELSERVEARREERSFVVVLKVWAHDADKSVAISNAIVEAFEAELFQSASESAGRVAKSLNDRLDEMRRSATDAERQVEEFRRANGLQSANGEPVSTRISAELNTQVLGAQQRFIEAESRYRQMSAAIAQKQAASASIFDSQSMTSLRAQYNVIGQQIGSIRTTYGTRHPQLVAALSEQAVLEAAMTREARRILDAAKADYDRERATLASLRSRAGDEKSTVFSDNDAQVQLRDLQRAARARAAIYETHLARAQQIAEQQKIDTSNVRTISRPIPPKARSWPPRTLYLVIAACVLGVLLGLSLAITRGALGQMR
jgi:polysaccharide biosynthesis transport protein